MPTDSSALLGTLVQAGAGIVAIIAGLLVARIATLSAERHVWDRRVRELMQIRALKIRNEDAARNDVIEFEADDFIDDILKDYVEAGGKPDFARLWRKYGTSEWRLEDFKPQLDRLAQQHRQIVRIIAGLSLTERNSCEWASDDERDAIEDSFESSRERLMAVYILDLVEEDWKQKKRVRNPYRGFSAVLEPIALPRSVTSATYRAARITADAAKRSDLLRAEDRARDELEAVELELKHALIARGELRRPRGVVFSILVLQVVTVFAVVIPLGQMALWGWTISRGQRILFVALFLLSLIIFFGYLIYEIIRFTKKPATLSSHDIDVD